MKNKIHLISLIVSFCLSQFGYAGGDQMGDLSIIPDEVMIIVLSNLSSSNIRKYSEVSHHAHHQASNPFLKRPTLFEGLAKNHHEVALKFYANVDPQEIETEFGFSVTPYGRSNPTIEQKREAVIHDQQTVGDPAIFLEKKSTPSPWKVWLSGFKQEDDTGELQESFWSSISNISFYASSSLKKALQEVPMKAEGLLQVNSYDTIHRMSDELLDDLELLSTNHAISIIVYRIKNGDYRCILGVTVGRCENFQFCRKKFQQSGSTPEFAIANAVNLLKRRKQLKSDNGRQFDRANMYLDRICKKSSSIFL